MWEIGKYIGHAWYNDDGKGQCQMQNGKTNTTAVLFSEWSEAQAYNPTPFFT